MKARTQDRNRVIAREHALKLEKQRLSKKIEDLTARKNAMEAELVLGEKIIEAIKTENAALHAEALQDIEKYVDALAVIHSEDNIDRPVHPMVAAMLAAAHWHGVETDEQAVEELRREVKRRSPEKAFDNVLSEYKPEHQGGVGDLLLKRLREYDAKLHGRQHDAQVRVGSVISQTVGPEVEGADLRVMRRVVQRIDAWLASTKEERLPLEQMEAFINEALADEVADPEQRLRVGQEVSQIVQNAYVAKMAEDSAGKSGERIHFDATQKSPAGAKTEPYSDHLMMRAGRAMWESTYALGMNDKEAAEAIRSQADKVHGAGILTEPFTPSSA